MGNQGHPSGPSADTEKPSLSWGVATPWRDAGRDDRGPTLASPVLSGIPALASLPGEQLRGTDRAGPTGSGAWQGGHLLND